MERISTHITEEQKASIDALSRLSKSTPEIRSLSKANALRSILAESLPGESMNDLDGIEFDIEEDRVHARGFGVEITEPIPE
jgi:hypothetical protein